MTQGISQSQTRLAVEDGRPIVIDTETAMDEVYSALSNQRRRAVLCVLVRESVPMELDTLVDKVAARETAADSDGPAMDLTDRVRVSLYHNHLPKLESLDLIAFDDEELIVRDVAATVSPVNEHV